jgi:hypothetical protein
MDDNDFVLYWDKTVITDQVAVTGYQLYRYAIRN